jgi:hypothetical protein
MKGETQNVRWIPLREGYQALGVSKPTFLELVKAGRIGTRQIPGLTRKTYDRLDIERLAQEGITPARTGSQVAARN